MFSTQRKVIVWRRQYCNPYYEEDALWWAATKRATKFLVAGSIVAAAMFGACWIIPALGVACGQN